VITEQAEKKPGLEPVAVPHGRGEGKIRHPTTIEYLRCTWTASPRRRGRDDIIHQAMYAILTKEHMLLLSRTGMAKSYLANYIFNTFENVRVFASQASKEQTPDNYFGPYNIEEFKKGRIRHNIHGSIIEANLVFLDEFFDASDVVLRSLLTVLNERKFINGQEIIDTAVHTAIATANYMRMNEVTEAVLDRFTYKSIIPEDNNSLYAAPHRPHLRLQPRQGDRAGEEDPLQPDHLPLGHHQEQEQGNTHQHTGLHLLHEKRDRQQVRQRHAQERIQLLYKPPQAGEDSRLPARIGGPRRPHRGEHGGHQERLYSPVHPEQLRLREGQGQIGEGRVPGRLPADARAFQRDRCHAAGRVSFKHKEDISGHTRESRKARPPARGARPPRRDQGLLKKIFPTRFKAEEDLTIETLKNSITEINPAVEEVRELKEGILRDFRDTI
jgi:hypothetical protein